MMVILITGGAGFIGSHLSEQLLSQGETVICIDNLDEYIYCSSLKHENLAHLSTYSAFTFIKADIRDKDLMRQIMLRFSCDAVIHLAAYAGVRSSVKDPEKFMDVNVNGTLSILEAMREAKVKKILFASSSSVYGNSTETLFKESDAADRPLSPYAASKRAAEIIAYSYHALYGFDITCLRLFTVYGPRQRPEMAISQFIKQIIAEHPIELYGDGTTYRNYTYVTDVVAGFKKALVRMNGYKVYNIGGDKTIFLNEVIKTIEKVAKKKSKVVYRPEQPGDMPHTAADISKARREIEYCPSISFEEGIQHCWSWLSEKQMVELV